MVEDLAKIAKLEWASPHRSGSATVLSAEELPETLTGSGIGRLARMNVRKIQEDLGVLMVGWEDSWEFGSREQFVFSTLANQAALALDNVRLLQQTQELAALGERNRLAREIHDSQAQGFTAIIWQVNAAERDVEGGGEKALQHLERIRSLARDCLQEARRSVWDLRAGPLGSRTLGEVLQQETEKVAEGGGIVISFDLSGEESVLPPGVEGAFLRICQESLANVLKHANATQVTVTLAFHDSQVRLSIRDNGVGFDPATPRAPDREGGGFGLINMRERARLWGGEFTAQSEPGKGTLVEAVLPLE